MVILFIIDALIISSSRIGYYPTYTIPHVWECLSWVILNQIKKDKSHGKKYLLYVNGKMKFEMVYVYVRFGFFKARSSRQV